MRQILTTVLDLVGVLLLVVFAYAVWAPAAFAAAGVGALAISWSLSRKPKVQPADEDDL